MYILTVLLALGHYTRTYMYIVHNNICTRVAVCLSSVCNKFFSTYIEFIIVISGFPYNAIGTLRVCVRMYK